MTDSTAARPIGHAEARCWIGIEHAVRGVSLDADLPDIEIPAAQWPEFAVAGRTVAVLDEGELSLRDTSNGEVLSVVPAPLASSVSTDGTQFWLDEDANARAITAIGTEGAIVKLPGDAGLAASSARWLASRMSGTFDQMSISVISTRPPFAEVLRTPPLMANGPVAFGDGTLLIATGSGVRSWSLTGSSQAIALPHLAVPPATLSGPFQIVGAPDGWYELWNDVVSERFEPESPGPNEWQTLVTVSHGRVASVRRGVRVERTFDARVFDLVVGNGRVWLLGSLDHDQPHEQAAGPVECLVLDDALEVEAVHALGDGAWRGGFAISGPHPEVQ